jgi:hypothetical protein
LRPLTQSVAHGTEGLGIYPPRRFELTDQAI